MIHLPLHIVYIDSPSPIVTIRLVEGGTQWDGRVEILNNKIWVAVCGNNWTLLNADVSYKYHTLL